MLYLYSPSSGMEWNGMIGFDPISSLPVDRQSFKHASLFSTCNFLSGNRPLHIFNPWLYSTEDNPDCVGAELPPFAASKRPIVSMPNFVPESYIISRLGSMPNNVTQSLNWRIYFVISLSRSGSLIILADCFSSGEYVVSFTSNRLSSSCSCNF